MEPAREGGWAHLVLVLRPPGPFLLSHHCSSEFDASQLKPTTEGEKRGFEEENNAQVSDCHKHILEPTKEGGNMGDKGEGTARDSDSLYPEGDYCPLSAKCYYEISVTKRGETPLCIMPLAGG